MFISPILLVPSDSLLQINHFCEIFMVQSISYLMIVHGNRAKIKSVSSLISVSFFPFEITLTISRHLLLIFVLVVNPHPTLFL